jgi:hypothetical protein
MTARRKENLSDTNEAPGGGKGRGEPSLAAIEASIFARYHYFMSMRHKRLLERVMSICLED